MTSPPRCVGEIEPVVASDCFDDVFGDLRKVLACKPISGPEATLIRACFEPMIARACLTQAEVDQAARQQESGQTANLNPRPPACLQLVTDLAGRCP